MSSISPLLAKRRKRKIQKERKKDRNKWQLTKKIEISNK